MSKSFLAALAVMAAAGCRGAERREVGAVDTSQGKLEATDTTALGNRSAPAAVIADSATSKPTTPAAKPKNAPTPTPTQAPEAQPAPAPPQPDTLSQSDMPPLPPGAPSAEAVTAAVSQLALIVYPAKGQSQERQVRDEQICYAFAKEQTGIDPTAVSVNTDSAAKAGKASADSATGGAGVRGAARGAAGGAAVGAIAGDAGTGAAIGAVAGAARGRKGKREAQKQAEQQAVTQAQTQAAGQTDAFKKAMSACLEGKGYTVR